jgi:hypothetical protein
MQRARKISNVRLSINRRARSLLRNYWRIPRQTNWLGPCSAVLTFCPRRRTTGRWTDFLYALYEMLKRQPADRRRDVDRSGLITGICYSVFVPLITRPRREYRNHVHSFVLAMMRQLPTDNRKQKRAYMNILNVLPILRGVIDDFPKRDLIKITSEEIPTSDDLIADAHAAILTQIRAILNAV